MNRFVRRAAAAALVAGGLGSAGCVSTDGSVARGAAPDSCRKAAKAGGCVGCDGGGDNEILRTYYDPCWPERYNQVARNEVIAPFAAQVHNGHVLNQTIWNWYFAPGTDTLTPAGRAKLDSIAQTRPGPDPRLYIQAARDVVVTNENMDKVAGFREDLTTKRAAAIQRYLATQPVIGTPVAYELFVHDPVVEGIRADFAAGAYRGQAQGYRGGIGGAAGTGAASTGGTGPAPSAAAVGGTGGGGGPNTGPTSPGPQPGPAPGVGQ